MKQFDEYWFAPEQGELRKSCAMGWAIRVWNASRDATQQPAEGEEIMVNTPYDVFTLPLQPSGLGGKGPRFVVHVPGPGHPAAPDVTALMEALEIIQKAATRENVRTGIRAATALGCIAAICDVALAAHRKGGVE